MMRTTSSRSKKQRPIVVIGAGMAGVETALTLADDGYKVILLEKKQEILSGTSNSTPCRVDLGLHYSDPVTAKQYLRATIAFVRKYKEFLLQPTSPELTGSDYLVMPDSHVKYRDIANLHVELLDEYRALCEENAENKLFGEPDKLMIPVDVPDIFRHSERTPLYCFRTRDVILDLPNIKAYLMERILTHRNIELRKGVSVESIHKSTPEDMGRDEDTTWAYRVSDPQYILSLTPTDHSFVLGKIEAVSTGSDASDDGTASEEECRISTDIIINASWYDIRRLNSTCGFSSKVQTARLKAMVEIILPPAMRNIRTSFFCFGPHCAITNLGNGRAFVTWEPATNMAQSSEETLPDDMRKFSDGEATDQEKSDIAQRILDGASHYIPGINTAKVRNVTFAVVLTDGGAVNINDPHSPHHLRTEDGVQDHEFGFASNACMKLLYGVQNAQKIESIVKSYTYIQENINSLLKVFQALPRIEYNKPVISYFFQEYTREYESFVRKSNQDSIMSGYIETLSNKITLLDQFKKAREEFHSQSTEDSSSEVNAASDQDIYTPRMFGKPQKYKKPYLQEDVEPWVIPAVRGFVKVN